MVGILIEHKVKKMNLILLTYIKSEIDKVSYLTCFF